jgi:hypothetical protein
MSRRIVLTVVLLGAMLVGCYHRQRILTCNDLAIDQAIACYESQLAAPSTPRLITCMQTGSMLICN